MVEFSPQVIKYKQKQLAEEFVDQLNEWLDKDDFAINNLVGYITVECNDKLGDDKNLITQEYPFDYHQYLNIIGLINGLLNSVGSKQHIVAIYNKEEEKKIVCFGLCEKK